MAEVLPTGIPASARIVLPKRGTTLSQVLDLRGDRALSAVSDFVLEVLVPPETELLEEVESLVGETAHIVVELADGPRTLLRGPISELDEAWRPDGHGLRLRVRDSLTQLEHRITSRVFARCSAVEVISQLLDEHEIAFEWRLSRRYPEREHIVQLRESDLSFLDHLVREHGLFFWYEHGAGASTLVLADAAPAYRDLACDLWWRGPVDTAPHGGGAEGGSGEGGAAAGASLTPAALFAWRVHREAAPRAFVHRQYDVRRPDVALDLPATFDEEEGSTFLGLSTSRLEDGTPRPSPGTVYRHRTVFSADEERGTREAVELGQHRRRAHTYRGRSAQATLAPGGVIRVGGHPYAKLNRAAAVTRITHVFGPGGDGRLVYANRFEAVPETVAHVAPPPAPRRFEGIELATVVGPAGDGDGHDDDDDREVDGVYTDELGRVQIAFHWEHDRRRAEGAWARVSQVLAGVAYGAQFIPRVGMEVLVAFVGGDPAQPVVVGTVYHGQAPHPQALPDARHYSGFRSQTVGGKDNATVSELLFNDLEQAEGMIVRTGGTFIEEVGRTMTRSVGGDERHHVDGRYKLDVQGKASASFNGRFRLTTQGNYFQRADGRTTRESKGPIYDRTDESLEVSSGGAIHHHAETAIQSIGNTFSLFARQEGAYSEVYSRGSISVTADKNLRLHARERLTIVCGQSTIRMSPRGIEIVAPEVSINGERATKVVGGGAAAHFAGALSLAGGQVVAASGGASLVLDANASLDGALVLLNCGGTAGAGVEGPEGPEEDSIPLTLLMRNVDQAPLAGWTYLVQAGDTSRAGLLGPDGKLDVRLPNTSSYVRVLVHRDGEVPRVFEVHVGAFAPVDTVVGIKQRLANLGLFRGPHDEEVDDGFYLAIHNFEGRQDLPLTPQHQVWVKGKIGLFPATLAALEEAAGG